MLRRTRGALVQLGHSMSARFASTLVEVPEEESDLDRRPLAELVVDETLDLGPTTQREGVLRESMFGRMWNSTI